MHVVGWRDFTPGNHSVPRSRERVRHSILQPPTDIGGASHATYHYTHLSDVQLSYSTCHPKLSFYRHGEEHVSNSQRPTPTKSRGLHLSFQPTQPAARRHQRSRTDRTGRIASHISQSDIVGKAASSTHHVPGICDFLLFRDGILSVYHVQVSFRFLQNGCRAQTFR